MSESELGPRLVDAKPNAPAREKAGYMLATATPMRADWEAAASPAARTSGRRRSRSFGIPTATSGGATGIGASPASRASTAYGVSPRRTASPFFAWRRVFCRLGIWDCV